MIKRFWVSVSVAVMMVAVPLAAEALQDPRPLATDQRIRTVRYTPNEIYSFVGHYGYQSSIEFAEDEEVQTVSIGDSLAWLVNPTGNRIFIKPIEQDALTNMTVITDKHTYHFELHAEESEDIRARNMVFVLRFIYPTDDVNTINVSQYEAMPDIYNEPEKFNFNYTIRGSEVISPLRIFDDGEFTYFEFPDKNADVPAFFRVDGLGNEEMVNFRTRGDYVVVERVASRFTLRNGTEVLCVYNETRPLSIPAQEPPGFWERNNPF